jgi:2-polyprenyl-3-methyl-5-hydroxy-6-metoxy-1,4-benzoquinol methylase
MNVPGKKTMTDITISENKILQDAKILYRSCRYLSRHIQSLRPRICPFVELLPYFSYNSQVLDVGCGSGLLLGLLVRNNLLATGIGFDMSSEAIACANRMKKSLHPHLQQTVDFHHVNINEAWPKGDFDIISLIDVMHHCPPASQRDLITTVAKRLPRGGRFIYKDMSTKPLWCAIANRFHDLVMARQWIHYCPAGDISKWAREDGLREISSGKRQMLWYAHEWLVFEK